MQHSKKPFIACLVLISLLATAGCQRGSGDGQPTAAVHGPSGQPTATDTQSVPAAKETQDLLHPEVVFETSLGDFTVRLDAVKAKLTVDNFLRYVAKKHYDGTIFHQVQKDYPKVVLGGEFTPDLKAVGNLDSFVRNEADRGLKNRRGTIAMARQPDSIDSAAPCSSSTSPTTTFWTTKTAPPKSTVMPSSAKLPMALRCWIAWPRFPCVMRRRCKTRRSNRS